MRRRLSFAAAALVVAAPIAGATAVHGCSSGEEFESVCLWVADPDNCYRKFRADSLDNGETCKPLGDPSPVNLADATNPNGTSNGSFLSREALDVCFIAGGGQVVFDPPIDLANYPPPLLAEPITYKMSFKRANGTDCGEATYKSPHGFSFTINAPADTGASASTDAGTTTGDAGTSDAGPPVPYGSYTQVIEPGRDAFNVTCPTGESHKFNLFEVQGVAVTEDGGTQASCPLFAEIVPRASLVINPGGIDAPGAVSFTIYWPPTDTTYPTEALQQTGDVIQPVAVTYFNCSIGAAPKTCQNGEKDPNETDVDCGGNEISSGCPARCGDGQGCITDCDCDPSLVCNVVSGVRVCGVYGGGGTGGGMATTPPPRDCSSVFICQNGKKDGAESDIDCGGSDCDGCANGKACTQDSDCAGGYCLNLVCATASCSDNVKNQGESDVDCGGANCMPCADGKTCTTSTDCSSGNCLNGVCSTPTCGDSAKNGSETDVDCGGACVNEGKACDNLKACLVNSDCKSFGCVNGTCLVPTCMDGVQDGIETDKDCGGSTATMNCPRCADGLMCNDSTDCLMNHVCGVASVTTTGTIKKCFVDTCGNTTKEGTESDIDCGGGACPLCTNGKTCTKNSDCESNGCVGGTCQTPTCADNVADGNETDVDCGGGTCPACATGKACKVDTDCAGLMTCLGNICQ